MKIHSSEILLGAYIMLATQNHGGGAGLLQGRLAGPRGRARAQAAKLVPHACEKAGAVELAARRLPGALQHPWFLLSAAGAHSSRAWGTAVWVQ